MFLAIPLFMYILWVLAPIVQTIFTSFTQWDGMSPAKEWVGFENFTRLFNDSVFWTSLINNLYWLILFVAIPVPVGLMIAMLFDTKLPGNKIYKTLFYLSMTLSFVVIAQIWSWLFEPRRGALSTFFQSIGIENLAQIQQGLSVFLLFIALPIALGFFIGWLFNRKLEYRTSKKRWGVTLTALAVTLITSFIVYRITGFELETSRM